MKSFTAAELTPEHYYDGGGGIIIDYARNKDNAISWRAFVFIRRLFLGLATGSSFNSVKLIRSLILLIKNGESLEINSLLSKSDTN